jgi:hypothetical protein
MQRKITVCMGKFEVYSCNVRIIAVSELCVYYVVEGQFFQLQFF